MSSPSTPIKMERRKALDWLGVALLKWLCIGVLIDFMGFPIALAAKAAFNGQGLSFHLVQDTAAYLIIALRLDDDIAIVSDTIGAIAGIVSYGLIVAKIPERKGFEFAKLRRRHIPGALGTAIVGIAISAAMSGNPVFVLHAYLSWIKTIRIATPYGLLSTRASSSRSSPYRSSAR